MGYNIKAILLDVDGTLTNDEKKITPHARWTSTREARLCQGDGAH